jgi:metal-responsive CopG/Arc/MetJ family transcriptional regulator
MKDETEMIHFRAPKLLKRRIDECVSRETLMNRSDFIRSAVIEKITKCESRRESTR